MSHTPGPWTAKDQGGGSRGKSLGICISGPNGFPLFFLPRSTPANEGNAPLVAAAPELLEALKLVVSISDRNTHAWNRAKAVIAKAEGKI